MRESETTTFLTLLYYFRNKLYGTASAHCEAVLKHQSNNPQLLLFRAICFIHEKKYSTAIRLLEELRDNEDFMLAVLLALKNAHSSTKVPDLEALREINSEIAKQSVSSNARLLFNAAVICHIFGLNNKAYDFVEKVASAIPEDLQAMCLRGWIWLLEGKDSKKVLKFFDAAIDQGYPDAFLGKARLLEQNHNVQEACQVLTSLLVRDPTFLPALIEYTKELFMCRVWSKIEEQVQRVLLIQANCVPVHLIRTVYAITVEGKPEFIQKSILDLQKVMDSLEKNNDCLYFKTSQLLVRILEYDSEASKVINDFLEKAIAIDKKPDYLGVKLRCLINSGKFKEVRTIATEALKEDAPPDVSLALASCLISENRIQDALAHMQFIQASQPKITENKYYLYFLALIAIAQKKPFSEFMQSIRKFIDPHFSKLQNLPFGIEFIREMDVNFLINIILELFTFASLSPIDGGDQALREINRILTFVHDKCPGLTRVEYLLAKTKYLCMETKATETLLQSCLNKNPYMAEAHLLMAQINVQKKNFAEAERCLSLGLSYNFKMQYHPIYHLVRAKVQKNAKNIEASVETLTSATQLPSFLPGFDNRREKMDVTDSDRISIHLELIDSLQKLGRLTEANEYLHEAMERWSNKPEEHQLMQMDANLHLQRRDVDGALTILAKFTPNHPNYTTARLQMADIYLSEKRDRSKFIECYQSLVENDQTPATNVLLGDAYMSIQEPVKAIEIYESVLKSNPKNDALAEKIGEAYIRCHLYSKAVTYYETALKSGLRDNMRIRLAELLIQLKSFEKCEKILCQVLNDDSEPTEIPKIITNVKFRTLLAAVYVEFQNVDKAINQLDKAYNLQGKLIEKPLGEAGNVDEQKAIAAEILSKLAYLYLSRREIGKAIEMYQESIDLSNRNTNAMLSLATLYKAAGRMEDCRKQCEEILKTDSSNTEAMLMLADLSYEKNEGDIASERFAQILDQNPNQYHVLYRYLNLKWRRGNVKSAEKYLKAALEANPRATTHAGLNYCKGLYHRQTSSYTGDPNGALQAFNRARRDAEWGEKATYYMIEICLSPDNEFIIGDNIDSGSTNDILQQIVNITDLKLERVLEKAMTELTSDFRSNINTREVRRETAERFLKELQLRPTLDQQYSLVENYIMLQHNDRNLVQQALNNFLEVAGPETGEVENLGALYGSAYAYLVLKQVHKAKAQLKRVLDRKWTFAEADYLEHCWIMLADIYIGQNKTDQATNVLRTLLRYNESSIKGFEYMGQVHEQEQRWSDAAANYDMAWQLTNKQHPGIGFKLAHCYLKAKKLFDCISVCHQVLAIYPNYPKLKKDIMDKARSRIRI